MSDLSKTFNQALDELEAEKRKVAEEREALRIELANVKVREKDLGNDIKDLERERKELEPIKKALENGNLLDNKEKGLLQTQTQLNEKARQLAKTENKLVAIQTNQTEQTTALEARQLAISEREENYKEKIRKDFMDEVAKKLAAH